MKTLFNESRNGTAARATEFCDLAAAIQFMKEKQKQHYVTTFPDWTGTTFVVYTWRIEK